MYCEQCGAKNEESTKFCTSCGANISENGEGQTKSISEKTKKPLPGFVKKIVIAVAAVAVLAGASVLGYNFISDNFGNSEGYENHPLIYAKNELIFMKNANKKEAWPLTEKYGYYGNDEYDGASVNYVQVSADGKIIFFADDIDDAEFKLYYRKTNQKVPRGDGADEKGIRVASGVNNFQASPNGDFVVYQKGDRLYISDLKEERSISSDVTYFNLSNDLQKIIFRKDGGDLYICGIGKNETPEKVDAEVGTILTDSGEYNKIYYRKDNDLYYKEYGKDKVKVTADIKNAMTIGDTHFITKEVKTQKKFDDLFNDDCASTDAEMTNPSYSDFKVPDEDGYMRTDYEAYYAARDKYNEKEARDDVREYYSKNAQEVTTYVLYKVVGTDIQEVETGLLDGYISNIFTKQASDNSKISMSSVKSLSDARTKVNDLQNNVELVAYILKSDGKMIPITDYDKDNYTNIQISSDEKYFYCVEDSNSNYRGTLNRYTITDSGLTSKEKIYDDASGYNLIDDVVIVHSGDEEMGIFDNGKYTHLSDSSNWRYQYVDGVLYFYDQYSYNNSVGNLMRYENGKKEQIDIDVHDFVIRGSKNCYYIKDYSKSSSRGELYQNTGGKSKHIDSDVGFIVY